MPTTIAISGKGGSGKTTLAAMLIRFLHDQTKKAVLAVDADPNFCLGQICGVQPVGTIAEAQEKAAQSQPSSSGVGRVRSNAT